MPDHDDEEHARRVASFCWEAARAAIYEAEAAQLTQGLRATNAALVIALRQLVIESEIAQDADDAAVNRNFGRAIENAHSALASFKAAP